ncbi:glycosyltransferase family 39 protein [Meredithblackwellia eburnea MCA 4105]
MDSHRDSQPLRSRRALTEQHHHDSTSSAAPAQQGPTPPTPTPFYIPSSATHNSRPTAIYAKSDSHRLLHSSKSSRDGSPAGKHSRNSFWSNIGGGLDLSNGENRVLIGLTILGAVVRFWHLGRPSSVVFDEVHFGGFANKYIQSRFFMDVHPPLAKLLITLMAWISGFKGGSFDFKDIGREYGPDHVPYLFMRSLPATMGLLLIPLSYLTLRALQTRPTTALLGSLLVMFDNGLTTQSRFILLDSPLIFFTALSVFFWAGFSNENDTPRDRHGRVGPFSRRWWLWLTLTGLALGAVVSCKWVGLFTIATVGVLTIVQLWTLLGDVRVPIPLLAKHFLARAVCLIAVPVVFYMSMFAIHFAILSNSGEGDGFMSSEFQHTLIGHGMEDTFQDVMVGSHITIRHLHTQGGYLHSHPSTYPGGSKQQQVTLYPHRDDNNIWLILNTTKSDDIDPETHSPPTPIMNGAFVVLHHIATNKKLHSHDIRAPVTEVDYQNEVSAYGFDGFDGDANDHFQIEIDDVETDTKGGHKDARKRLQTLRTKFKLRHLLTGCYLFSHKVKLPDWGFEQQEVTCNKNPSKENAIWYVETNTHQALPPTAKKVNYRRPGFFKKFAELQAVMWQTNAGLTDRHAYDSRPESWPVLKRGINFWVKDHRQIYLLGNPFVWFFSTLSVLAYVGVRALLILRAQRGYQDFVHTQVVYYDKLGAFLVLGWFLHYFPFFLMQRQLFLHHYFPALYFAILLSACVFDLTTSMLKPRIRLQVAIVLLLITLYNFWYFSPLTYAGVWTRQQCENAKWLRNWDFSW